MLISDEERVNVEWLGRTDTYIQCDSSERRVGCGPHLGCMGVKRVFRTRIQIWQLSSKEKFDWPCIQFDRVPRLTLCSCSRILDRTWQMSLAPPPVCLLSVYIMSGGDALQDSEGMEPTV